MAGTARRARASALSSIRLLVLDVDGVLTDGVLHYGPDGELEKCFHVRDGYGIKAAVTAGLQVAIISGRRSAAVQRRCEELGIRHVHQGVEDKGPVFERLCQTLAVSAKECACVGDDVPDLPLLRQAGVAITVADAHPLARAAAHRVTKSRGGHGAVREVCDWLLSARAGRGG